MNLNNLFEIIEKGGKGSGNHGHGGRPGKRGGSTSKGGGGSVSGGASVKLNSPKDRKKVVEDKIKNLISESEGKTNKQIKARGLEDHPAVKDYKTGKINGAEMLKKLGDKGKGIEVNSLPKMTPHAEKIKNRGEDQYFDDMTKQDADSWALLYILGDAQIDSHSMYIP